MSMVVLQITLIMQHKQLQTKNVKELIPNQFTSVFGVLTFSRSMIHVSQAVSLFFHKQTNVFLSKVLPKSFPPVLKKPPC